jgi:FkbH-like protein
VSAADSPQAARVSQLTLRTNQFNLTTRRLQPPDVRELIGDPSALVLAVRAADRFGDSGLVGAIFTRRAGDTVNIDNFLLSCRVFSRGVEQAALCALLRHAAATGARSVTADYRRTAKNENVRQFYPRNGFRTVADDGSAATFRHDLGDIAPPPPHIELITEL